MSFSLWFRLNRAHRGSRAGRSGRPRRPRLEQLEDRTVLAGHTLATATALPFVGGTAQAAGFLAQPGEVDLYEVSLQPGDKVSVSAQTAGSGLAPLLRGGRTGLPRSWTKSRLRAARRWRSRWMSRTKPP